MTSLGNPVLISTLLMFLISLNMMFKILDSPHKLIRNTSSFALQYQDTHIWENVVW